MPRVQCLDILVDPTVAALGGAGDLFDLPGFDSPGDVVADTSTNNNAAGLGDRNPGRKFRKGGSGQQPNRNVSMVAAADDTLATTVGAAFTSVNVLTNDTWALKPLGTPTIRIVEGPRLAGATAIVTGSGTSSRIKYTPPATGTGGQDRIMYRLSAVGNYGSDLAILDVTVSVGDPHEGGIYTGSSWSVGCQDFLYLCPKLTVSTIWNGNLTSVLFAIAAADDAQDVAFFTGLGTGIVVLIIDVETYNALPDGGQSSPFTLTLGSAFPGTADGTAFNATFTF